MEAKRPLQNTGDLDADSTRKVDRESSQHELAG